MAYIYGIPRPFEGLLELLEVTETPPTWCGALGAVKLAGNVIDPPTWCGVATTLCAGDVETPSFVEKLLSGTGGQDDRDCVHGKDLVAE